MWLVSRRYILWIDGYQRTFTPLLAQVTVLLHVSSTYRVVSRMGIRRGVSILTSRLNESTKKYNSKLSLDHSSLGFTGWVNGLRYCLRQFLVAMMLLVKSSPRASMLLPLL